MSPSRRLTLGGRGAPWIAAFPACRLRRPRGDSCGGGWGTVGSVPAPERAAAALDGLLLREHAVLRRGAIGRDGGAVSCATQGRRGGFFIHLPRGGSRSATAATTAARTQDVSFRAADPDLVSPADFPSSACPTPTGAWHGGMPPVLGVQGKHGEAAKGGMPLDNCWRWRRGGFRIDRYPISIKAPCTAGIWAKLPHLR